MSLVRRFIERSIAREWTTLGLEFSLIVVGVLFALAIDSWVQIKDDRAAEQEYLQLLVRDLSLTIEQLQTTSIYAAETIDLGLAAYRELANVGSTMNIDVIEQGVSALTGRLTVRPYQATFTDLISTGNLRLIESRPLRDEIISYYETAQLNYQTFDRNRAFFNDELFAEYTIGEALIVPYISDHPVPAINKTVDELTKALGEDFVHRPGLLSELPVEAPEWERLRTRVWAMVLTTNFLKITATSMLSEATDLKDKIESMLE